MYHRTHYEFAEFAEEAICAVIMALSVLNSIYLSSSKEGIVNINVMIFSVFGANFAWGMIDGVVQYVGIEVRRARFKRLSRSLRASMKLDQFISHLQHNIDEDILHTWGEDAVALLFTKKERLADPEKIILSSKDLLAFVGVMAVYLFAAIAVTAPLLIIHPSYNAVVTSNILATIALFAIGYGWGCSTEQNHPFYFGLIIAFVGFVLLGLCVSLGG
ncbi:MAG: hypothetical protein K2Q26_14560 [Bdellovibrionales bacterium]|nr:hypothetical protein [Bdellovibrionales bacterium]